MSEPLPDDVRNFVESTAWRYAKTYATTWPHEYVVRTSENARMILALARHIFEHGIDGRFYDQVRKYHHEDGKVYWSMDPTPEATTLVNRCDEDQTYEARAATVMPLSERWQRLCADMGARTKVRSAYDDLVNHYQEAGRAYHNLSHVNKCLEEYDLLKADAANGIAVECAIWFHDAIYDTRAKDNEQRSAILAESALGGMGIAGGLPHTVGRLILLTKHDRAPSTVDEQIVVDVDLAILGAPTEAFDEYEAQIRCEYSWVSDTVFWPKRRELLAALLARPYIYFTSRCRDKYEASARRNLQRSILRLGPGDLPCHRGPGKGRHA